MTPAAEAFLQFVLMNLPTLVTDAQSLIKNSQTVSSLFTEKRNPTDDEWTAILAVVNPKHAQIQAIQA